MTTLTDQSINDRPRLIQACERMLSRFVPHAAIGEAHALSRVPDSVLMVKVHGLGDSVMVRSLIEQFRLRHPRVRVGLMVGVVNRDVMTLGTDMAVYVYDQSNLSLGAILRQLSALRQGSYQAMLNFEQGSLAGSAFLRATGIRLRVGFVAPDGKAKAALLTHALCFHSQDSMCRSFIRLLQVLDPEFPDLPQVRPLPLGSATVQWARSWMAQRGGGCKRKIVLHLGCAKGQLFKQWSVECFVDLAEQMRNWIGSVSFYLTGQSAELPLIEKFMATYSGRAINASELGSIERTAALMAECDLLVSNDTGIMHLGAAMGTPTVGLFGATSPRYWAPLGPRATYVYTTRVGCSPCVDHYAGRTPVACANPSGNQCMRDIDVNAVFEAARRVTVGGWLG